MNYQHRWYQTDEARRQPRTSDAVPVASHKMTLCPHCAARQPISRLVGYGCFVCGRLPNTPGQFTGLR